LRALSRSFSSSESLRASSSAFLAEIINYYTACNLFFKKNL
jgi:hypothetical protein